MSKRLTDKVAIVTGAARGLGRAYAEALAGAGAAVVVADIADCSETTAAITAAGGSAIACPLDVADGARIGSAQLVSAEMEKLGARYPCTWLPVMSSRICLAFFTSSRKVDRLREAINSCA